MVKAKKSTKKFKQKHLKGEIAARKRVQKAKRYKTQRATRQGGCRQRSTADTPLPRPSPVRSGIGCFYRVYLD